MSDVKKYYYMRLKDNFFDDEVMKLLEGMQDGYLYQNIFLKLCLTSLKNGGKLALNGVIPYSPEMIATVTRHQIGTVERALELFKKIGLIEILDDGTIYMLNIQNFIGTASTEADRQREYDRRISEEKKSVRNLGETYTITNSNKTISKQQLANSKQQKENKKLTRANIQSIAQQESLTDLMMDFIEYRDRMRKPLTMRAAQMILNKLEEYAPGDVDKKIQIIEKSMTSGWTDVYPLRDVDVKSKKEEEPQTFGGFVLQ